MPTRYIPGDRIGNHSLVINITRGGFSDVYFCLRGDSIPVVMKTPRLDFSATISTQNVIHREAENWIALGKHPNIVQCYMLENFDATPFLELEWIMGKHENDFFHTSLRHRMNKQLSLKQALEIAMHICRGLVHMQEVMPGVIHQDLKPENILVANDGIAKITDFGLTEIAKSMEHEPLSFEPSSRHLPPTIISRHIAGTPPYMAPEQFESEMLINYKVDIYAFGCILYEMFAGHRPYEVASKYYQTKDANTRLNAWKQQHQKVDPIALSDSLPKLLKQVVLKCLSKNPDSRFEDPLEIFNLLEKTYYQKFKTNPQLLDFYEDETSFEVANKGRTYFNLGKISKAIEMYDQAIRIDDSSADSYIRRGFALCAATRVSEGLKDINHGIDLDPTYAFGYSIRAQIYSISGNIEHALSDFKKSIELDPKDHYLHEKMGKFLLDIKDYHGSVNAFHKAIETNPRCHFAISKLGQSYRLLGDISTAFQYQEQAISVNPYYEFAYAERGELHRINGNLNDALTDFDLALEINPTDSFSLSHKGVIRRETGDVKGALEDLNDTLELYPNYAWAIAERGETYRQLGKLNIAVQEFYKSLEIKSNDWVYACLAEAQQELGQSNEALVSLAYAVALKEIEEQKPKSKDFLKLITLWKDEQYDDVNKLFQEIMKSADDPSSDTLELIKTIVYLDLNTARNCSSKARRQLSGLFLAVNSIDYCLIQLNLAYQQDSNGITDFYSPLLYLCDFKKNEDAKFRILNFFCDNKIQISDSFCQRGLIHIEKGRKEQGRIDLEQAVKIDSKNLRAYIELGISYRESEMHQEALRIYSIAIDSGLREAVLFNNRGNSYHDLGMFHEAIVDRNQAITISPSYYLAYFNRGNSYRSIGNIKKAITDYRYCIRLKPDFKNVYFQLFELYIQQGTINELFEAMKSLVSNNLFEDSEAIFWLLHNLNRNEDIDLIINYFPVVKSFEFINSMNSAKEELTRQFSGQQFERNFCRLLELVQKI